MARFHGPRGKVVRRLGGFQAFESPKFGSMKNTYPRTTWSNDEKTYFRIWSTTS